jgi:hypothetical protein
VQAKLANIHKNISSIQANFAIFFFYFCCPKSFDEASNGKAPQHGPGSSIPHTPQAQQMPDVEHNPGRPHLNCGLSVFHAFSLTRKRVRNDYDSTTLILAGGIIDYKEDK